MVSVLVVVVQVVPAYYLYKKSLLNFFTITYKEERNFSEYLL